MRKIMRVGERVVEFICDSEDEFAVWEVYVDDEYVGETDEPMALTLLCPWPCSALGPARPLALGPARPLDPLGPWTRSSLGPARPLDPLGPSAL